MDNLSAVESIMNKLNESGLTSGNMNSWLISKYPSGDCKLSLHTDDESEQINWRTALFIVFI